MLAWDPGRAGRDIVPNLAAPCWCGASSPRSSAPRAMPRARRVQLPALAAPPREHRRSRRARGLLEVGIAAWRMSPRPPRPALACCGWGESRARLRVWPWCSNPPRNLRRGLDAAACLATRRGIGLKAASVRALRSVTRRLPPYRRCPSGLRPLRTSCSPSAASSPAVSHGAVLVVRNARRPPGHAPIRRPLVNCAAALRATSGKGFRLEGARRQTSAVTRGPAEGVSRRPARPPPSGGLPSLSALWAHVRPLLRVSLVLAGNIVLGRGRNIAHDGGWREKASRPRPAPPPFWLRGRAPAASANRADALREGCLPQQHAAASYSIDGGPCSCTVKVTRSWSSM